MWQNNHVINRTWGFILKYRNCLCFSVAVLCLPLFANTINVPTLDTPTHTDLEVNKCVDIPDSCYSGLRYLTLDISFNNASPSNGFYAAFGNDTGNEYLEFEEMAFQVGFDQGRWKLREKGMVHTYTCTNDFAQTGTKSLRMRIKVNKDGQPRQITFKDGDNLFAFPGLDLSSIETIPSYFTPPFTDLKVTRRGYFSDEPEDSTSVNFSMGGIKLIIF